MTKITQLSQLDLTASYSYAGDDMAVPYLFSGLAIDLPSLFKDN
jgi:hypothetical protein